MSSILDDLNRQQKQYLLELLGELDERTKYNRIASLFPDEGPLRRELYARHIEFMFAGADHKERALFGGNQSGKSISGAYETALHATGRYPTWWKGKRFNRPVKIWVAGDTSDTTRDICQTLLLGPIYDMGTGMIPRSALLNDKGEFTVTTAAGTPGAKKDVYVKHVSGGLSQIGFKTYEQGRRSFQGTAQDYVWFDEECPMDVYTEALTRTITTKGSITLTFTPLSGLSDVVMTYLPDGQFPATATGCGEVKDSNKWISRIDWEHAPHLTEQEKNDIKASYLPHELEARTKGIPMVGSGKIYPIPESEFTVEPFDIPAYWPRAYGMDVGWNVTAAIWGAYDEANDVLYLYKEYKSCNQLPPQHASIIRYRDPWIPGAVDPAAASLRMKKDGDSLLHEYSELGLELYKANNAVDAGLLNVLNRLATGRLKVFNHLTQWFNEYRIYRRDEKLHVVKKNDDLMDCTRYLCMTGIQIATTYPDEDDDDKIVRFAKSQGRNSITGY